MAIDKNTLAQQYARRRAKNLAYFQKFHPSLFKRFNQYPMRRVEVAISPAENDIDVLSDGQSLYGGKAAAVGREEAGDLIRHYKEVGVVKSIRPLMSRALDGSGFAERWLNKAVSRSPVRPEEFKGYPLNNLFFPQLVFMGCGAGFHIQYVLESLRTVNAVVFEPDPELFAASLFCVDWEAIGARFNEAKGESLAFLIGGDRPMTEKQQITVLQSCLYPTAPIYPYMSVFINHQKQPKMASVLKAFGQGIHKFQTSWLDYDETLRRARNCFHNMSGSPSVLSSQSLAEGFGNVVIVGSGPSIDDRFEQLRNNRDRFLLVSAGTGIKGLIDNGLVPDYHVELDPDYLVFGYLQLLGKEKLKDVKLIAVNEVNPLVPPLFDSSYLYFKAENPATPVFSSRAQSFELCNPTVTNAALSVFTSLGTDRVFLFGCDLGYKSLSRHHSAASIYQDDNLSAGADPKQTEVSGRLKKRADVRSDQRASFLVPGVDGTKVFTRSDFFVAKQEMEALIEKHPDSGTVFYNCSDGAEITGTEWLSREAFTDHLDDANPLLSLDDHASMLESPPLSPLAENLVGSVEIHAERMKVAVKALKLKGQRDLARAVFALAKKNRTAPLRPGASSLTADQVYAQYIINGSITTFLMMGLSHGMAIQDKKQLMSFLEGWVEDFSAFLTELPGHFREVLCDTAAPEEDPWVLSTMKWIRPEPDMPENGVASV